MRTKRIREMMVMLVIGGVMSVLAGCQSTANGYQPANCAMVGSSCSRT
ncbi:MAG: hypothetical protein ABWY13_00805 [Mesorhizobium sp.]